MKTQSSNSHVLVNNHSETKLQIKPVQNHADVDPEPPWNFRMVTQEDHLVLDSFSAQAPAPGRQPRELSERSASHHAVHPYGFREKHWI